MKITTIAATVVVALLAAAGVSGTAEAATGAELPMWALGVIAVVGLAMRKLWAYLAADTDGDGEPDIIAAISKRWPILAGPLRDAAKRGLLADLVTHLGVVARDWLLRQAGDAVAVEEKSADVAKCAPLAIVLAVLLALASASCGGAVATVTDPGVRFSGMAPAGFEGACGDRYGADGCEAVAGAAGALKVEAAGDVCLYVFGKKLPPICGEVGAHTWATVATDGTAEAGVCVELPFGGAFCLEGGQ